MITSLVTTAVTVAVGAAVVLTITQANLDNTNAATQRSYGHVLPATLIVHVTWDPATLVGFVAASVIGTMLPILGLVVILRTPVEATMDLRDRLVIRLGVSVMASVLLGLTLGAIALAVDHPTQWVLLTADFASLVVLYATAGAFRRDQREPRNWKDAREWGLGVTWVVMLFLGLMPLVVGSGSLLNGLQRMVIG